MKLLSHIKNFLIGMVFAFIITMASPFIASIFTGHEPAELINLCGESFIGLFILIFPIYYTYKCSKDNVNPPNRISIKYIIFSLIAAMTILIVIYTYVTQNRYSNNNYIENNLNKNNASRLLSLCEFNIIFPGKMKEKEITTKSGYVINSYLSAIKSPPLLRAECIPVNLHTNNTNIKQYIKVLIESQAKENNIEIIETSYGSLKIGETGRLIGRTLKQGVEGVFVMKVVVGEKSVLLLYASEFKANYPSPDMIKFMDNITMR